MSWLFGQAWLWYLAAFLVGLLLAWLGFVRPQQRRLKALLRTRSPSIPDGSGPAVTGAGPASPAAAATTARVPLPPSGPSPLVDPAGDARISAEAADAPTADTTAEPAAGPTTDAPTDVFPAVDPALSTLDTAYIVAADAPTPPEGVPTEHPDGAPSRSNGT